jgi:predicted dithiol-disulfide oxidoreductase (DUF899 family)
MKTKSGKILPKIVSREKWEAARKKILAKEKKLTHQHDALAAQRRRSPMVKIEKDYVFDGPEGKRSLLDLFEGRTQLILYHFMFAPGVGGWPDAGCPGCSLVIDHMGHLAHIHSRDTSLALVAKAPLKNIERYKKRMGWTLPWVSSAENSFNVDFGLSKGEKETYGMSVFFRDGDSIYHTYFTDGRGVEALGSPWTLLDLTPLGRQETWEDSPPGWPQSAPFVWWQRHDEYEKNGKIKSKKKK